MRFGMLPSQSSCVIGLLLIAMVGCAGPQPREAPVVTPMPVLDHELAGEFNNLYRLGDVYFAGYPTQAGLYEMKQRGVNTVVSLRTLEQVEAAREFDEQQAADELGMTLVVIPIVPDTFSEADVDAFAEVFERSEGPFLLHCGSSNTVGGLWAAYMRRYRDVPLDQALQLGRAAGLRAESMIEATKRVAGP